MNQISSIDSKIDFETLVSLRQAYLVMFTFLENQYESLGKPEELGCLLGELSLWKAENGNEPIDAAVFPEWLKAAKEVLKAERVGGSYDRADIRPSKN